MVISEVSLIGRVYASYVPHSKPHPYVEQKQRALSAHTIEVPPVQACSTIQARLQNTPDKDHFLQTGAPDKNHV